LKRHYTVPAHSQIMGYLYLNVGLGLLKSDKLEKRIQGLKEIIEQIRNTRHGITRRSLHVKEVIDKVKEERVFELVFGESYHIQLV